MPKKEIQYRYENKYLLGGDSVDLLKREIRLLLPMDSHSVNDEYSYDIRSLYFDDPFQSNYLEKKDGVQFRAKYRLRMYNENPGKIQLECKHKDDNMTYKESCTLPKNIVELILEGDYDKVRELYKPAGNLVIDWEKESDFFLRFLTEAKMKELRPSVIVDYRRTAFVYPSSEVRITFDENLMTLKNNFDLFDFDAPKLNIYDPGQAVLEVKYNEYLPAHIQAVLSTVPVIKNSVSKFVACRAIY